MQKNTEQEFRNILKKPTHKHAKIEPNQKNKNKTEILNTQVYFLMLLSPTNRFRDNKNEIESLAH